MAVEAGLYDFGRIEVRDGKITCLVCPNRRKFRSLASALRHTQEEHTDEDQP